MNQLQLKSLLTVKICNLLLAEEMDNIKGTTAYRQDIKNLVNKLAQKLDREYSETYRLYDNDEVAEIALNHTVTILESFVDIVSNMKSAEDFLVLGERLKQLNF